MAGLLAKRAATAIKLRTLQPRPANNPCLDKLHRGRKIWFLPLRTQIVPRSALVDGGRSTEAACVEEASNSQPLLSMQMSWW